MTHIILSGSAMETREALHAQLRDRLPLPDWYGGNLDALYDCLTDLREPVVLVLRDRPAMLASLGKYGETVLRVLRDAAEENERLGLEIL